MQVRGVPRRVAGGAHRAEQIALPDPLPFAQAAGVPIQMCIVVDEALGVAARLAPKRTLLTHLCHRLEHRFINILQLF